MNLNEKNENLNTNGASAKLLALNSPHKRIMMLAALKTTFVVLAVLYSILLIFGLSYIGHSYHKANKNVQALKQNIVVLQAENNNLRKALEISNKEIIDISTSLAVKENELDKANQELDKIHKRVPIHRVVTKNQNYVYRPYFYAMQSTKFNKHYLSEKDMTTVLEWSSKYGIDPNLVLGIMWVESRYYPKAKSKSSSASGYGQFIKSTGKWTHESLLKRKDKYDHTVHPFNPDDAIPMMCAYLNHLIKISKGDIRKVLIRYNGNELGKRYYELIDEYFARVSSNIDLDSIEKNIKINYKLL